MAHTKEIAYVCGFPLLKLNPALRQESGILTDTEDWTTDDQEWSDFFMDLWTNFAKYG